MERPVPLILQPAERIGAAALGWLAGFGEFWLFTWRMVGQLATGWWHWQNWRLLAPQLYNVGTRSVPVVMITGLFVGMVMAVQSYDQFAAAGLADRLGMLVNLTVVRELGPVLAAVMLAGRVGGALSAELGTMRVTEQIDAVRAMGANPIRYLVCPRFLACMLLTPLLTVYCDVMGILGGYFIAVQIYGVSEPFYWASSADAVAFWDIFTGLVKSLFFGAAIAQISCFKGFHCRAGAEGVGRATTEAFVLNLIAILVLDFFLAVLMQSLAFRIWGFKAILG